MCAKHSFRARFPCQAGWAKGAALYGGLPLVLTLFALTLGRYPISLGDLFGCLSALLCGRPLDEFETVATVLFQIRLPRILGALLVGCALALSGTVYQSTFRNPMVSPGILGITSGAGFGAAMGMLLSLNFFGVQCMAFVFGLMAVGLSYWISRMVGRDNGSVILLVLAGMVVGTIFSSLLSLCKFMADPDDTLPSITFWLMGSLSSFSTRDIFYLAIPVFLGSIPLLLNRWKLNVQAVGDNEARAMGLNTSRLRLLVILCSTIITAAAISVSGIIGWVGLLIPHICRMMVGPNHQKLVPLSMLVGALYLLGVDTLARTVSSLEIPLGIITSLIGAPFFIYLMMQKRKVWS
jgi:iron complex transport system permease protein